MKNLNIGISTSVVSVGILLMEVHLGDIEKFETDDETDVVLMIGEIVSPKKLRQVSLQKRI